MFYNNFMLFAENCHYSLRYCREKSLILHTVLKDFLLQDKTL